MSEFEDLLSSVESSEVRSLAEEARRCFTVGATRGCVSLTWTAVCTDVIEKVRRLAEDGDPRAIGHAAEIQKAQDEPHEPAAIQLIQGFERGILDVALELELIDAIEKRQLERLRHDRNLCSHPSYRAGGESYEPSQQYARAHLFTALHVLLSRTHVQGERVFERFISHVNDPSFTGQRPHLQRTYFDPVRSATRGRIVDTAVKHSLLELAADGHDPSQIADRMAICVASFCERDYDLVATKVRKSIARFRAVPNDVQLRTLARLGSLDAFWDSIDGELVHHLSSLVHTVTPGTRFEPLTTTASQVLALTAHPRCRMRLPILQTTFDTLSAGQKTQVIAVRSDSYFQPFAATLMAEARSYRTAEQVGWNAVLPFARTLTPVELQEILDAIAQNEQARQASGMRPILVDLYEATRHLEWEDLDGWRNFFLQVEAAEPESSGYRYPDIKDRIKVAYGDNWETEG